VNRERERERERERDRETERLRIFYVKFEGKKASTDDPVPPQTTSNLNERRPCVSRTPCVSCKPMQSWDLSVSDHTHYFEMPVGLYCATAPEDLAPFPM